MSPEEIRTAIIEPFNALIKRQRLEAAKKERDKELTLAPTLSKRSKIIAERKLIEQSAELTTLNNDLQQLVEKRHINTVPAKRTILDKQKQLTPRLAVLYIDGKRRID